RTPECQGFRYPRARTRASQVPKARCSGRSWTRPANASGISTTGRRVSAGVTRCSTCSTWPRSPPSWASRRGAWPLASAPRPEVRGRRCGSASGRGQLLHPGVHQHLSPGVQPVWLPGSLRLRHQPDRGQPAGRAKRFRPGRASPGTPCPEFRVERSAGTMGDMGASQVSLPAAEGSEGAWPGDESGLPPERYLDREESWLRFNERVLELAEDESIPLLERVRFLAIFATNLDEFFMVRVAGLMRRMVAGFPVEGAGVRLPGQVLENTLELAGELTVRHARAFSERINPELVEHGIELLRWKELSAQERDNLGDLEVDEDITENLLQAMERELVRRRFEPAVRLEVEDTMSADVLDRLVTELGMDKRAVYRVSGPLDLSGLSGIADLKIGELRYPAFVPSTRAIPQENSIFSAIAERDILVHH